MHKLVSVLGVFILGSCGSAVSPGAFVEAAVPKHAVLWNAVVTSQQPKVFQEASMNSGLVMHLKKGDSVGVVLKISVLGEDWCRIELPDQTEPAGYVGCEQLELAPSSPRAKVNSGPKSNSNNISSVSNQQFSGVHLASQGALTNRDILDMSKTGLSSDILVAKIRSSACSFDTSPTALQTLKTASLEDKVILAMVEAPVGHSDAPVATTSAIPPGSAKIVPVSTAPNTSSLVANEVSQSSTSSTCVILKRMGPADQITSHMYSFGIRGKQFQYVEGQLPKSVTFHGRLTDHDIRIIQDKGGRLYILEPKYSVADLQEARKGCQKPDSQLP
jgi:hypothetical protein